MKIVGIILAGGKSSRMGFDKTKIDFKGKSFLDKTIALMENFTDNILVSSNNDVDIKYPIIKDEIKNIGPLGGIYTILKNIKNDVALIIPADMPMLDKEIIKKLIENYSENDDICVFENNGKPEMLVGIYHKRLLPIIEKQIEKKEYKLQILLQKSVSKKIDGSLFTQQFININTPDDLKKYISKI